MQDAVRKCANCDGVIGRFETSREWQGHTVCQACYGRLTPSEAREPVRPLLAPSPDRRPEEEEEEVIWEGTSSQITNLQVFTVCVLFVIIIGVAAVFIGHWVGITWVGLLVALAVIVPIAVGLRKWLDVRFKKYTLTTQRLRVVTGIFSKRIEELELYRVKDTTYLQPFFLRLFDLGHIVLTTSDKSSPVVIIRAVPEVRERREQIRRCVEARRDAKGVREVDFK